MRAHGPEALPSEPLPSVVCHRAWGETRAVVLVLHGGKSVSKEATTTSHLSVLRMIPFARRLRRRAARKGVAVWRVRYRYRGWNADEASPVADARWALEEVRRRHGDVPVVLLGHSMGGRTALRVSDDPSVTAAVTLAPWLPAGEPVDGVRGKRVVVLHGDQDLMTSAGASAAWAARARAVVDRVVYAAVARGEHFMLRRWLLWHRLATAFVVDALADAEVLRRPGRGRTARLVAEAVGQLDPVTV